LIEIERKFLVKSDKYRSDAFKVQLLSQAYLNNNPDKSVRIRIVDNEGFITIKGPSNDGGFSRFEWEKKIPFDEAVELMKLCGDQLILKKRYFVKHNKIILEVVNETLWRSANFKKKVFCKTQQNNLRS